MGVSEKPPGLFWKGASLYAGMICVNEGTVPGSNIVAVSLGHVDAVWWVGRGGSTPWAGGAKGYLVK